MVMDDLQKEQMRGLNASSSELEILLKQLNVHDHPQVLETIIQIRNLVIGNNNFKTFFLNDRLLRRLMDVMLESANDLNSSRNLEIVKQIILVFGSLALGTLNHVTKLVQRFQLHRFLFDFLGKLEFVQLKDTTPHNMRLLLIESILRCLSNIYTTAQVIPSIIMTLDQQLYGNQKPAFDLLLKMFNLSDVTKQTVISILSVSSTNFLVASIHSGTRKNSSAVLERINQFRSRVIKSTAISHFAVLLTSLQPIVQLNALKFYAAICFEDFQASIAVLSCHYYNMPLIELISTYLTGDNSIELQLYASKCLTNLCRSTTGRFENGDSASTETTLPKEPNCLIVDYKSPLICNRTLSTLVHICTTCWASLRGSAKIRGTSLAAHLVVPKWTQLTLKASKGIDASLLVQGLSTLAYLIELNSDLQEKASHLEQIISTISLSISDAFQALKTPDSKTSGYFDGNELSKTGLKHKQDCDHDQDLRAPKQKRVPSRKIRSRHLRQFQNVKMKSQKQQRQKNANARKYLEAKEKTSEDSDSNANGNKYANQSHKQNTAAYSVQSSLFSSLYVRFNQLAAIGIHVRLNEHQYPWSTTEAVQNMEALIESNVNIDEIGGIDCSQINKYQDQQLPTERQIFRPIKFIKNLNQLTNKALIAVSFHALAAFAQNSEDARRQVSDYSGVMAHILYCLDQDIFMGQPVNEQTDHGSSAIIDSVDEGDDYRDENILCSTLSSDDDENGDANRPDDYCDLFGELEDQDSRFEDLEWLNASDKDSECIMRFSALCLLHSLSRSVHQLRTKFLDQKIWTILLELMRQARYLSINISRSISNETKPADTIGKLTLSQRQATSNDEETEEFEATIPTPKFGIIDQIDSDKNESDESRGRELERHNGSIVTTEHKSICILTAVISNLLLEFSPSKEMMFENGIIGILVDLLEYPMLPVKINCVWALMNMAFNSGQKVKQEILATVTMEKLFQLLTEKDQELIMKTLGLLRNLVTFRPHVDLIMTIYGTRIIQAIIMVLERDTLSLPIKEQALTILANVADGSNSKEFIMDNEDLLRKISSFMTANCVELQITAVSCLSNLVVNTEDGAGQRQAKIKDLGAHRILQKLLNTSDLILLEKVKYALQQFSVISSNSSTSLSGAHGPSSGTGASSSSSSSTSINSTNIP